jgi:hypothetical protein
MGNLIVKNGTPVQVITEIEVTKNGQPIKQMTGLNIQPNNCSDQIPLKAGTYVVTATFRDKNGKIATAQKTVTITEGKTTHCEFIQVPQEAEVCIPQNLVESKGNG